MSREFRYGSQPMLSRVLRLWQSMLGNKNGGIKVKIREGLDCSPWGGGRFMASLLRFSREMRKMALAAGKIGALIAITMGASACATVFDGKSQQIAINTNPTGAECGLYRQGLRIATIQSSPGMALIEKSKYDIWVVCVKSGYQLSTYFNHSGIAGATFGNILGGVVTGGIAWGIDSANGADNKYDSPVNISMPANAPDQPPGPSTLPPTFNMGEMGKGSSSLPPPADAPPPSATPVAPGATPPPQNTPAPAASNSPPPAKTDAAPSSPPIPSDQYQSRFRL